jgi:hypothetical protein
VGGPVVRIDAASDITQHTQRVIRIAAQRTVIPDRKVQQSVDRVWKQEATRCIDKLFLRRRSD